MYSVGANFKIWGPVLCSKALQLIFRECQYAMRKYMAGHIYIYNIIVSRVAQSVQCLATGWTTGSSRFDPRQRRNNFSSVFCVQTASGAHILL
jgi:hypothetical protein